MKGVITEEEYRAYTNDRAKELVMRFADCFRKYRVNEVAKATGLRWETINALRRGRNVTFATICKVELFFKSKGLL